MDKDHAALQEVGSQFAAIDIKYMAGYHGFEVLFLEFKLQRFEFASVTTCTTWSEVEAATFQAKREAQIQADEATTDKKRLTSARWGLNSG